MKEFESIYLLSNERKKLFLIATDSEYKVYLSNLKQSKIYKEDNCESENNSVEILNLINDSVIPYLIVYIPHGYVNLKKYLENNRNNKIEELRFTNFKMEKEIQYLKLKNQKDIEELQLKNQKEIELLTSKNIKMEKEMEELKKQIEQLKDSLNK